MADRARKTMVTLLAATILLSGLAVGISSVASRVDALRAQIAEYEGQISRVERTGDPSGAVAEPAASLTELDARISAERSRYYAPTEISLSRFAEQIQRELTSAGLTVLRYRPVESGSDTARTSVEFVIRGNAERFMTFVRNSRAASRYRFFSAVAARASGVAGRIDATFRIGYEEKALDRDK